MTGESPGAHPVLSVSFPKGSSESVYFLEVKFIMLFENVTPSNRCYFWSLCNFILEGEKNVLAGVKSFLAASDWYTGFPSGFFSSAMTACRQAEAASSLPVSTGFQTWSGHHPAVTNVPGAQRSSSP